MFKKNKNNELENLIVQTKKKEKIKKESVDIKWILSVTITAFSI